MLARFLSLGVALPLLVQPLCAQTVSKVYDNFSGNSLSEARWDWDTLQNVSVSNGLLHIFGPPNGTFGIFSSTHGFRGDFAIVLDFRNFVTTATRFQNNWPQIWLKVMQESSREQDYMFISRAKSSTRHLVFGGGKVKNVTQAGSAAQVSGGSGLLRVLREGNKVSTSYDLGAGWKTLQTFSKGFDGIVRIEIGSYSGDNGTFTVDSDRVYYSKAELIVPPKVYGSACHGIGIFEGSFATVGNQQFSIGVDGAPPAANLWFLLGVSNTKWQGQNLPLNLAPMGAPNCFLLTSMDILLAGIKADNNGEFLLPAPIPNDSKLVGTTVYCQWVAEKRNANAWGLIWSDGLEVKVLK